MVRVIYWGHPEGGRAEMFLGPCTVTVTERAILDTRWREPELTLHKT